MVVFSQSLDKPQWSGPNTSPVNMTGCVFLHAQKLPSKTMSPKFVNAGIADHFRHSVVALT